MAKDLNSNEYRYRKTVGSMGFTMLIFVLLFYGSSFLCSIFADVILMFPITEEFYVISVNLLSGGLYLLSFMLPVLIFKRRIARNGFSYQPMNVEPRITPWLPLIILASVLIVHTASEINYGIVTLFDTASSGDSYVGSVIEYKGYELVLQLITVCVVPAFCEEFLFRGAFLSNLLPFGRTTAIIASSLLFALMHENPVQILYTFIAGMLLGLIYVKTGSIWNCIILHLFNNFFSVIEEMIYYNLYQWADWAIPLWRTGIYLLGSVSLAILILVFFSKKQRFEEGIYQKELEPSDSYASLVVEPERSVKLFFTPCMITYLILAALSIFGLWIGGGF